jgi:voltage-gated potassium channel
MSPDVRAALALFEGLRADQLERLAGLFRLADYPAGAEIFSAGDRAHHLYLVSAGEVVIRYQPHDGGLLDIATLSPGEAFGWSAALKRSYYTSAAFAVTDVQALVIGAQDLHHIMAEDPEIGEALLERAARIASSRLDGLGRQVIQMLKPKSPPKSGRPS